MGFRADPSNGIPHFGKPPYNVSPPLQDPRIVTVACQFAWLAAKTHMRYLSLVIPVSSCKDIKSMGC